MCFLAVDVLKKTMVEKLPNDLEGLEATIERLQEMIDRVFRYVDDVLVDCFPSNDFCNCLLFGKL